MTRTLVCPDCGSPDTEVKQFVNETRTPGPGEWAYYECNECFQVWRSIVLEPPEADGEAYRGDEARAALRDEQIAAMRLK